MCLECVTDGLPVFVCGNGGKLLVKHECEATTYVVGVQYSGANPRHATLLAGVVPPSKVIRTLDRFIMYYIRTADKLMRTARWLEGMEGGIDVSGRSNATRPLN